MATHINADDPVRANALFRACLIVSRYRQRYGQAPSEAQINALLAAVMATRGDGIAANRARRAAQREVSRLGWDGWNDQ